MPTLRSKPENLLLNLVCNIAAPTAILTWLSGARGLGPRWGLLVALAFPVGYGVYDFIARRRWNFISIIGFASVLISGGFGLLQVGGLWFAVKDAAIPGMIGLAVLASMKAKSPLVTELLYNPQVIEVEKVD
ncbi:MAG: VC0807 family protein, partial [Opitutaceae bacterium]